MLRSYHTIFELIIGITIMGFGMVIIFLFLGLSHLLFDNEIWYIPFFILGLAVAIFAGVFINMILSIPLKLAHQFDIIKNKVALEEITTLQQFQDEVAEFVLTFFNFLGADIIGGKFHFANCTTLVKDCNIDFNQLKEADFTKQVIHLPKRHKAYHIPIRLGNHNLGYMILITHGFTIPFLYSILEDFENYYLDDQIKYFLLK